jgi:hypothetical protein
MRSCRTPGGVERVIWAYADVRTERYYPPNRCIELREGRVEICVAELPHE